MIKKYRHRYFYPILILSLMGFGLSCGKHREPHDPEHEEAQIAQKDPADKQDLKQTPGQRRQGKRSAQAVGRGFGGRGRGSGGRNWGPSDVIELTSEETDAIEIETVRAAYMPLKSKLAAMGKVLEHPYRKAIVSYAFPARISQIHVRIGDWVKRGQKLITLQSEEVGNAKSDFYKAQADYELARVNYERQKRLFDRGVGAQKDYLSAESDFKVAEANLNSAEKKLHVLGFNEEEVQAIADTHQINPIIVLYAPIAGKITVNNAILGALIDQETEILTIMDPTILCIDAEIYEKDIAKIRDKQQVEVSVPAYPRDQFNAEVCFIGDVLNEDTRTITVRSEVNNSDFKLKPGMFADIRILLNHQSKTLVLPKEAILDDGDNRIVFIAKSGKYYPQIVELGASEDSFIEIIRGIREGEEVVTTGNFQLKSKLYDEILKKGHVH
jgi:cobalt-zinc-cadmium efflux system membrane fusion protein